MDHCIGGVEEASLWEVLLGAILVVVCFQSSSSGPFIDLIDEVMMHKSCFLLNIIVREEYLLVAQEAADGEWVVEA